MAKYLYIIECATGRNTPAKNPKEFNWGARTVSSIYHGRLGSKYQAAGIAKVRLELYQNLFDFNSLPEPLPDKGDFPEITDAVGKFHFMPPVRGYGNMHILSLCREKNKSGRQICGNFQKSDFRRFPKFPKLRKPHPIKMCKKCLI